MLLREKLSPFSCYFKLKKYRDKTFLKKRNMKLHKVFLYVDFTYNFLSFIIWYTCMVKCVRYWDISVINIMLNNNKE